jgi:hypothetical protein
MAGAQICEAAKKPVPLYLWQQDSVQRQIFKNVLLLLQYLTALAACRIPTFLAFRLAITK